MGKRELVLLLISLGIIGTFLGAMYLMSTINPDPFPETRLSQGKEAVMESHEPDTAQLAAPFETEKMDGEVTDFYKSKRPGSYSNSGRKVVPPIWPRRKLEKIITPTIQVMPPIWPTTSERTDTDATRSIKLEQYDASTNKEISVSNKSEVKSRKSRSNYEYISHDDVRSIILKIINNTGKPSIEIKLHPKSCLKNKNAKINRYSKNNAPLTTKLENNNDLDNHSQIANHTVVNVCGNDTIVIDESVDLDVLKLIELIKLISSDSMDNDITNITNENITTLPLNKNASDKMLVHDKIESFNNIAENSSYTDTTSTTDPMKRDITDFGITHLVNNDVTKIFEGVEKSSKIDTTADTQINNKEFNKIAFNEKDIDSVTHKKSDALDNVTILISDIIQSNITDLYIENDSDIFY